MARQIPVSKIPDRLRDKLNDLVRATLIEAHGRIIEDTPIGETSRLSLSWQLQLPPKGSGGTEGQITTNVEYAEPVVYGTALPPSWGGKYRTRQATEPGYPDLIAKELGPWAQAYWEAIMRRG